MSWLSDAAKHHAKGLQDELKQVAVESLNGVSRLLLSQLLGLLSEVFQHVTGGSNEPQHPPAAAQPSAPASDPPAAPQRSFEDALNDTNITL